MIASFAALREASDGKVPLIQRQLKTPKSTILGRRAPQPLQPTLRPIVNLATALARKECSGSLPLRAVPSLAMSGISTITELQRCADLAVIRAAVKARLQDKSAATIGLADIAELCKRDLRARPTRDCHDVRDQILQIAIEWDLDRDALDQQSNVCLRAIVSFLR
jgi:hypothetical protein